MRRYAGMLAAVAGLATACEAGWLHERGLRVIREVSVGEGGRLLEDPETRLVQVRGPEDRGDRVPGSDFFSSGAPLPAELPARVVILAEDLDEGLRLAARLSRAGIQDVAVVRGGVSAWRAARQDETPAESPAEGGAAT